MPAAANNICPSSLISVLVSATAITSFGIPCSKREEATASSCVRYSVFISLIWLIPKMIPRPNSKTAKKVKKRKNPLICLSRHILIQTPLSIGIQTHELLSNVLDEMGLLLLFLGADAHIQTKCCHQQNFPCRPITHSELYLL